MRSLRRVPRSKKGSSRAAARPCCAAVPRSKTGLRSSRATSRPAALIVSRALEEPLKWIAINAGLEGSVMVREVASVEGTTGLNAISGALEDLVKSGIIDPAKVTRSALQNAASIAALLLTTEVLVADKPEKKPEPAAAGAGGMGMM